MSDTNAARTKRWSAATVTSGTLPNVVQPHSNDVPFREEESTCFTEVGGCFLLTTFQFKEKKMMKRLCMFATFLTMCAFLVVCVGCDSVSAVAKDKKNQVEKYLKDATVLQRARVQLADAQKSRVKLKEIADKFNVDSEVASRQIKRLEEERGKTIEAFKKVQDAAKKAELPKLSDATSEDKAKSIQIGTKAYTGADVYRILGEYKAEVEKASSAVEREQKRSDFLKDRAEKIRSQMTRVDNNIAEMERKIADYEMYQELLAANKTMDALGLSDDKMDELLNTGSMMAELQKKVDESDVILDLKDQENRSTDLKQEINRGSSFSITDEDLI